MFIAQVDFEENPSNLEPIIQYKKNGKTIYSVERRVDIITIIDIALIISSGGKIHSIDKCMFFKSYDTYMNPWIEKCNALKKKGELEQNTAMKTLGKLMANSSYG